MWRHGWILAGVVATGTMIGLPAAEKPDLKAILGRQVLEPRQTLGEVERYTDERVPRLPQVKTVAEWEILANRLRAETLEKVVYRGQAAAWRDAKTEVKWLETIPGGPGYRIKKLRYEALPGLWIPALLYEPEKLPGKMPVVLNVNGHDGNGKAAGYKQIRCINLAKRGMLALNVDWLGMGQLRTQGFQHYRMNQLDLCGTSGLAPFYLSMKRGLDVLLALENADPGRVAVTGLSGGGWQTIFISSLDTRVTLTTPVAGYSGFRTRVLHHKDLGDSEQTPCDLATVVDYTHLTAMMAPRATLLTYNAKDNCCFEAGYALPPLLEAAGPIFKLYGKERSLRAHVNHDPGTHNYEKDNREAFYRMVGDHFYPDNSGYSALEIPSAGEVKTKDELNVDLPDDNADFNSLALALSKNLPKDTGRPPSEARKALHQVVRAKEYQVVPEIISAEENDGLKVKYWKLRMNKEWTVPVVEVSRGTPMGTTILMNDAGRANDPINAGRFLAAGRRVLAVDPFYFGECKITTKDTLFALMVATVGDRSLGIQASQLAAVARWSQREHGQPASLAAVGPRTSTIALVAAALEQGAIDKIELHGALGSLKEIIEQNRSVDQMPELFCFGLLEAFDVKQLVILIAPRPVSFIEASARVKKELASLKELYQRQGVDFEPLK